MRFKLCTKVALALPLLIAMLSNIQQTVTMAQASLKSNNSSSFGSTSSKTGSISNRITTNQTSIELLPRGNTTSTPKDTLETAPTITSVHQVWTSSSSGSVDELSPEMISKLRNDVPFLAAYALRPRLVGASVPSLLPSIASIGDGHMSGGARQSLDTSSSDRSRVVVVNRGGNPPIVKTNARQQVVSAESLVPKLGDFSEFNVETSSTSKSEHHHKRKTILKRPPSGTKRAGIVPDSDVAGESSTLRRRTSAPTNKRKRSNSNNGSRKSRDKKVGADSKLTKRQSVTKKGNGKERSSKGGKSFGSLTNIRQVSSGKQRPAGGGLSVIKRGRLQEQSIGSNGVGGGKTDEIDVDMRAVDDTTSSTTRPGIGASKGGDEGVKGGSTSGTKRPPFYAAASSGGKQPTKSPEATTSSGRKDQEDADNDNEASLADGKDRGGKTRPDSKEQGNDIDERKPEVGDRAGGSKRDDDDDEPVDEPKRVGDDDVDEDGDTVLIEPKSDGVDDDPPLPLEGDEEEGNGPKSSEGDNDERRTGPTRDDDEDGSGIKNVPVGDPRGNRSGRDRPNSPPREGSDSSDDAIGTGGQAVSGGGGIGATIGGGGGSADDDENDGERDSPRGHKGERPATGSPGVEFANENGSKNDNANDDDERPRSNRPRDEKGNADSDGEEGLQDNKSADDSSTKAKGEGDFGERRKEVDGRQPNSRDGNHGDKTGSDTDDLDYRDEMAETERRPGGGGERGHSDKDHRAGDKDEEPDEHSGKKESVAGKPDGKSKTGHEVVGGSSKEHCDDGSYNHHHEHHDEHHHHHDTIDWLRGSIPGEPDDDYPILSRVNATNFKCSDQKHPGYYADVESRCQVSCSTE